MTRLYHVAQWLLGILGAVTLLGVLWFGDGLQRPVFLSGVVLGFTSIAILLLLRLSPSNMIGRASIVLLGVIGDTAGAILVSNDLFAPSPVEWDVVLIRG